MTDSPSTSASFSLSEMFLHAGLIVQLVMCLLFLACLISVAVYITKSLELRFMQKTLGKDSNILENADSLKNAKETISAHSAAGILITAALAEQEKSSDLMHNQEGIKERIALHLERLEAAEGRRLASHAAILSTIAATAPFIGLFGTVWGIMTSFTGIAASKTTNLAVVAPGIAEALLATALGLVAAIPSVILYNHLVSRTFHCRALLADITAQIMRLTSRDMDRQKTNLVPGHNTFRIMPRLAGE